VQIPNTVGASSQRQRSSKAHPFPPRIAAACGAVGTELWGGEIDLIGHSLHPLALSFGISGSLMISRIRVPKP